MHEKRNRLKYSIYGPRCVPGDLLKSIYCELPILYVGPTLNIFEEINPVMHLVYDFENNELCEWDLYHFRFLEE